MSTVPTTTTSTINHTHNHHQSTAAKKTPTKISNLFPQPRPNKITNHKQNKKSPITELGFSEEDSVDVGLIGGREVGLRQMGLIGGKPKQWSEWRWVSVEMED